MAKAMATMVKVERRCCREPSFIGEIISEVVMLCCSKIEDALLSTGCY
jgi:hypothetical protein